MLVFARCEFAPFDGQLILDFLAEKVELAALARRKPARPDLAERFELYAGGLELANGFSELTDPVEQRERFEAERSRRAAAGSRSRCSMTGWVGTRSDR